MIQVSDLEFSFQYVDTVTFDPAGYGITYDQQFVKYTHVPTDTGVVNVVPVVVSAGFDICLYHKRNIERNRAFTYGANKTDNDIFVETLFFYKLVESIREVAKDIFVVDSPVVDHNGIPVTLSSRLMNGRQELIDMCVDKTVFLMDTFNISALDYTTFTPKSQTKIRIAIV